MKNKSESELLTVKQYALREGITVAGVYLRIKRETLLSIKQYNRTLVFPASDKTIKKPRRK